ncbi:MAG: chemotaxis-specific protein-glutamate methyltransferase CheB [Desulfovibrionaceae bacterium]
MNTILIVDDSRIIRNILSIALKQDNTLSIITAENGQDALKKIIEYAPKIVVLDIDMPVMDGFTTLEHIMKNNPIPVIIMSSLTQKGADLNLRALDLGAVDYMPKCTNQEINFSILKEELLEKIHYFIAHPLPNISSFNLSKIPKHKQSHSNHRKLFLIGTSTGGPIALQKILATLPDDFSHTIVIAQHIPKNFTQSLCNRLHSTTALRVIIPQDNTIMEPATVYLCEGGFQTLICEENNQYIFRTVEDNEHHSYRPSIDFLFTSVAKIEKLAMKTSAFILTGMGQDGLIGCTNLYEHTKEIYAQNKETSLIFGMPKAIITSGIAKNQLNLEEIVYKIITS